MEQFIHQNTCPKCGFTRCWKLRRGARKCKKCRKEWSPKRRVGGFRSPVSEWKELVNSFLRDGRILKVAETLDKERHVVQRMIAKIRKVMGDDVPKSFSGTVEMDETYVGGRWVNKPAWIRRSQKAKKGHGTSKQAVFGILNRDTESVRVFLVPDLKESTLYPLITSILAPGTKVYTDGYSIYKPMKRYFKRHHIVDHAGGEYARGNIHTNTIESFWAYLKKNLSTIGEIRSEYFSLFVGEFVWRYNHRWLSREEQTQIILKKLVED